MSDLERIDPASPPPGTTVVFCDRCRQLKPCRRFQSPRGGIEWLCSETCAPKPQEILRAIVANSPPPRDAVNSPELAQWLDPQTPPDLNADVPQELLDLEIDRLLAAEDIARESEPIGPEQRAVPDDEGGP